MARGQTESPDKPCTPSVRWSDERVRDKRTAVPATPWRPRILRRDLSNDNDQPSPLDRKVTLPPLKLMRDDTMFSPAPSSATLVQGVEKHDEPKGDAYRCTPNSPFLPRAPPNTTTKPDHSFRSANEETDAQTLSGFLREGGGMNKADETNVYVNGLPKEINDNMLYLLGSFCGVVISHKAMLDRHTGMCKGFGFLMYATPDMATTAIEWLNSHGFSASFAKESFSARLRRMADTSSTNVYLSNLPVKLNEAQLEQLFNPHPVASLKILYDVHGESKSVGFVRLFDRQTARTCIERLHGRVLPGTTLPLQVRFADSEAQKHLKHSAQQKHTLESLGLLNHKAPPSPAVDTRGMQSEVRSRQWGEEVRPSGVVASRACVGMPSVPVSPELISSNLYGPGGLGIQVPPMWANAHPMVNAMQLAQPMLAEWTSMPTAQMVFPEPLFHATDQYRVPVVDWAQKKNEPEPLAALPRPFIPPPGLVPRDGDDTPSQPARRQHVRKEARFDGAARVRIAGGEARSNNDGARAVSDPTTLLAAQSRIRDASGAGRVRRAMSAEHNHNVHDDDTASSERADDDDSSLSIEIQIHADA